MKIVTGYTGQPHITSNEAQALNQGIFGSGNYVLDIGNKFAATLTNATTVTIQDGEGVMQGVQFRIAPGDTEAVSISPGTSGYKRIDYICARYTKNALTGVESVNLVVVEGTPDASTPTPPTVNTGTILTGSSPVDFPLYKVSLNGLTPTISAMNTGRIIEYSTTDTIALSGSGVSGWYIGDITHKTITLDPGCYLFCVRVEARATSALSDLYSALKKNGMVVTHQMAKPASQISLNDICCVSMSCVVNVGVGDSITVSSSVLATSSTSISAWSEISIFGL